MDGLPWYMWLVFILFLIGIVVNTIVVGTTTSSSQEAKDTRTAIITMASINAVLTIILGFAALYYMGQNPSFERPYTQIVVHMSLLASVLSVSINALQKI